MKKCIYLILITLFVITNSIYAQVQKQIIRQSPKVQKINKMPVGFDLRTLDTLLNPITAVTEVYQIDIKKMLSKIDLLDGEEDKQVKHFINSTTDELINNKIYKGAKHAAVYIENETFDASPVANFNIKKRFLVQIKDNLNLFLSNLKSQTFPVDSFANMFNRTEDLAEATKNSLFNTYVKNNCDLSTYFNKGLFYNNAELTNNIMNAMCKSNPQIMGNNLKTLQKYENFCDVINYLATNKSNDILTYVTSTSTDRDVILECQNPLIQSINEIGEKSKRPLRAVAMLGDFVNKKLTIEQIDAIANNNDLYLKKLIDLQQKNEVVSKYVIERDLKLTATEYTRTMNELHEGSEAARFKCIEKLGPVELYYICVIGNSEIYTSSYLGVYKRLMAKLKPKDGSQLIKMVNYDKFRTFIRMSANYNTLNEFLATMKDDDKTELMKKFVNGLGTNKAVDLEGAVDVADSFGSITDEDLLKFLKQNVSESYEQSIADNNPKVANIYKILNSLFNINSKDSVSEKTENELQLPNLNKVSAQSLHWDTCQTVYEQMFFYGDDDGKVGYNSFLGTFNRSNWKVDITNPDWTVISSIKTKIPLVIYANKPLDEPKDDEAQMHLLDFLIEKDIHPTIMVHRGHSYHLKSTIQALNYENKIVILGSCGGYQNLSDILTRCPDAHIISTKQVGKFTVNTPIINAVNKSIYDNKDVDWVSIWANLEKQFKGTADESFFNDYIPPHKNLGSLFLKSYNKLSNKTID